jgi:hypothetical protein
MSQYDASHYNSRWWVARNGKLVGAYSTGALRSYVFPLYTPRGVLVLQESPADHPHHQGICVGLNIDSHDLWNAGSFAVPRNQQEPLPTSDKWQPKVSKDDVLFEHQARWVTVDGKELLLENRAVRLSQRDEYTLVEWRSEFFHPSKSSKIAQTKEAGIGLRVPPHWETIWGGQIRNAHGDVGEKGCFDKPSPWLNIQSNADEAGLIFVPSKSTEKCPWFTRDYGLHGYNPSRHHPYELKAGESFFWEVKVLAYDGARNIEEVDRMAKL